MAILSSFLNVPRVLEWGIFVAFILAAFYTYQYFTLCRPHLPPGPRPDPIIGNLRQIPQERSEKVFAEWSNTYGDVVYAQLLGKQMIILNSLQSARELLEKRSAIYSDRPRFILLTELMGWHSHSTLLRYGPRFRKHRRYMQQVFNQRAVLTFRPLQAKETGVLLDGLVRTPGSHMEHVKRYAGATIIKVTYGHTVKSVDDEFLRLAERAATLTVESGTPSATLVDFFPLMKYLPAWVPGGGFQRSAAEARKAVEKMMTVPFETVKRDMRSGTASPSFTSSLLEAHRKAGAETVTAEDEEDIKGVAGTLISAAEDTTSAVLSTFVLAMVLHPEVYEKAQEEMRLVIEPGRLPDFNDRASLPYLECVLKEVFRWNCPVPLGLPHRLITDDVYRGYYIPRGAMVIANIWAMSQDCSHPEIFRPERYMDEADLIDPLAAVFGFGRRNCPGRYFAESGIWLAMARITATLRLSKSLDEQGREITPSAEFNTGFVSHPKPFPCSIQPLSGQCVGLIHQAHADVEP